MTNNISLGQDNKAVKCRRQEPVQLQEPSIIRKEAPQIEKEKICRISEYEILVMTQKLYEKELLLANIISLLTCGTQLIPSSPVYEKGETEIKAAMLIYKNREYVNVLACTQILDFLIASIKNYKNCDKSPIGLLLQTEKNDIIRCSNLVLYGLLRVNGIQQRRLTAYNYDEIESALQCYNCDMSSYQFSGKGCREGVKTDFTKTQFGQKQAPTLSPQFNRNDIQYGAVRQKIANTCPNIVNDKDGTVRVDTTAYQEVLLENLQAIDLKFIESNRWLNKYGSERHFKQRQKAITKSIKTFGKTKTCQTVVITEDDLIINGISFGSASGYGDSSYFTVLDSFDFPNFFTQFNGIRHLVLDGSAYIRLCDETQLGYGALEKVLQMEPNLTLIEFPDLRSNKMTKLTRDVRSRSAYVKAEEKRFQEEQEAAKILEESFLFGGPIAGIQSGDVLKRTPRNQQRARRVLKRTSAYSKARVAAKRYTRRTLSDKAIGVMGTIVGVMVASPIIWLHSQIRQVEADI